MNILTLIPVVLILSSPTEPASPAVTTFKTIILINGIPTVAEIQSNSRVLSTYGQVPSYFTSRESDAEIIQQVVETAVIYADTAIQSLAIEDELPADDIINESVTDIARDMAVAYGDGASSMQINITVEGHMANEMPIQKLEILLQDFGVKPEDIVTRLISTPDTSDRPSIKMSLVHRPSAVL